MKRATQISESIELATFLAMSGGLMDAYSYLYRGQVFANAQTGNILLLGVNASQGQWTTCLHYLFPVLSFALGIAICETIRLRKVQFIHWRQFTVLLEIILLCFVAFIPTDYNLVANSLTSFACGIQVQAFRKLHGNSFATTMCIGNLRSGTDHFIHFLHTKDRNFLEKSMLYYFVIFCFILGAILGNLCLSFLGIHTILVSVVLLIIALLIMFIDREGE